MVIVEFEKKEDWSRGVELLLGEMENYSFFGELRLLIREQAAWYLEKKGMQFKTIELENRE